MPPSRNLRKVLDVDPDSPNSRCVGERKDGGRCGLRMSNESDRPHASALLMKMDTQALRDSYDDLKELAFLTLCSRWHRKSGYSQVDQVAMRWGQKIQQLEKEEAEMAIMIRSSRALRKQAASEIKVPVVKERKEKIPATWQQSQKNGSFKAAKTSNTADPFVNSNSSVHESVVETPFTQRLQASRTRTRTSETPSYITSSRQSTFSKVKSNIQDDSSIIPMRILTLPSPPDTPLVLRQGERQGDRQNTEDENERLPILATGLKTESTKPVDTSRPFNSHQFGISNSIEGPQQTPPSFASLTLQPPVASPNYWLETPKSTQTSTVQLREGFGFDQRIITPAAFGFETPSTSSLTKSFSNKPTTTCDNANDIDSELKKGGMEHIDKEVQEMQAARFSKQPEVNKDIPDTAPTSMTSGEGSTLPEMAKAAPEDDIPQTPDQPSDEDFGYVVITSSTRSRTYIPATHRYGLVTPPDEPNNMVTPIVKASTPTMANSHPATPSHMTSQRKHFMIPRKPVNPEFKPTPPTKPLGYKATSQSGRGHEEAEKLASNTVNSVNVDIRPCSLTSHDEDIQSGCLHISSIRRLREKIVHKVEHIQVHKLFQSMKITIP